MQSSSTATKTTLQEQIERLQQRAKQQRAQGAIILGRWFQARALGLDSSLATRMEVALRDTLIRPRDRLLFDLPVQNARALKSATVEEELLAVQEQRRELKAREENLLRRKRQALRQEDDARRILQGEVIRRWRDKDPAFAKMLETDLPLYLQQPADFAVLEVAVPEGWQPTQRKAAKANNGEPAQEPSRPAEREPLKVSTSDTTGSVSGTAKLPEPSLAVTKAAQSAEQPQKSSPKTASLPTPSQQTRPASFAAPAKGSSAEEGGTP